MRWLTLGFLVFTLIYLPHGVLTRHVHEGLALFPVFDPASRGIMAACFFVALLYYGSPAPTPRKRDSSAGSGCAAGRRSG